jgi:hypothetical protein
MDRHGLSKDISTVFDYVTIDPVKEESGEQSTTIFQVVETKELSTSVAFEPNTAYNNQNRKSSI